MAPTGVATSAAAALPRLLYIGDVSVADTMAGEALLFRLLQFYPPEKLAIVCGVRADMPMLPGVAYHHWGPMFPRLLYSRVAAEYILWRAWRYFEVPPALAHIATMFKPEAVLTISHVSGWLAAWQIAAARNVPLHIVAHDDFVYANRFPAWAQPWAARKFGEAYRAARGRFCISEAMEEVYRRRFGAAGQVLHPTYKSSSAGTARTVKDGRATSSLVFAYGGSINSLSDLDQIIDCARVVSRRGHRLVAFTPQHDQLSARAASRGVAIEVHAPIHSDALRARLWADADCVFLPQSLVEADRPLVSTAFPTKWADSSTLGLPLLVWAPPESSSACFVKANPGCAELVTTADPSTLEPAVDRIATSPDHRRSLAERLLQTGRNAFSPEAAWKTFYETVVSDSGPRERAVDIA